MAYFFDSTDPLTQWQSETASKIASNRGQNQPAILKIDQLLGNYKNAKSDSERLGILEGLTFVIERWLSNYDGKREAAGRKLLKDTKLRREYYWGLDVKPTPVPPSQLTVPTPVYTEMLARNKEPGDKYYTIGMLRDGGLGKDLNNSSLVNNLKHNKEDPDDWKGLTYMNEQQRVRFLVDAEGGLLRHHSAPPKQSLETSKSHITGKPISNKVYIFVMDGKGRIFSAAKEDVEHHSSFLAGNPAAAAGCMRVINGQVDYINAESGHYQPLKDDIDQFVAELNARGVDTSKVEFGKMANRVTFQANAKSKGIKRVRIYPTGPRDERC